MGYTNYYYQERDFTVDEWKLVVNEADYLKELGYSVMAGQDMDEILISGDCEALLLRKQRRTEKHYEDDNLSFGFCKTRMAQYDLAVWYLLCSCNQLLGEDFRIGRDR
mgnify:FL=1